MEERTKTRRAYCDNIDFMLVQFGMNGCNYWDFDKGMQRVSPRAFMANLQEIIARGRTFGAQRIVLNINHPTTCTRKTLSDGKTAHQRQDRGRKYQYWHDSNTSSLKLRQSSLPDNQSMFYI